jgi:hypothetical protein
MTCSHSEMIWGGVKAPTCAKRLATRKQVPSDRPQKPESFRGTGRPAKPVYASAFSLGCAPVHAARSRFSRAACSSRSSFASRSRLVCSASCKDFVWILLNGCLLAQVSSCYRRPASLELMTEVFTSLKSEVSAISDRREQWTWLIRSGLTQLPTGKVRWRRVHR